MHEEWSYDITLFIADFGGSMGFLLGVSILSVLEIVEGIFISIYQLIRQRKEDKQREDEEEQDHESTKLADKTSENNTSIQTEIDNNNDQMTVT